MEFPVAIPGIFLLGRLIRKYYFAFFEKMENQKKTFHEIILLIVLAIFFVAVFLKTVFF